MAGRRVERVARAIREAVSEVFLSQLKDPRMGFVTITRVEATADLREATVYFSVMGEVAEQRRVGQCIQHARGFIQREVGRRLVMRFCPHLTFAEDARFKESLEIERLIQLTRQERHADAEPPATDPRGGAEPEGTGCAEDGSHEGPDVA